MAGEDLTTEQGMKAYLQANLSPSCRTVQRLPEGSGGFVYRVEVDQPLDGRKNFVVKHAEGYAARAPVWKMSQRRLDFEQKALKYISTLPRLPDVPVRAPKVLSYDEASHVVVMEDLGNLPSVKGWLQPAVDIGIARQIGSALGKFLAHFHNTSASDASIKAEFNGNDTGKQISSAAYYGRLAAAAAAFGYHDECIAKAAEVGQKEIAESSDVLTLGDFWTGNVLVSASGALELYVLDLELAKPGTAAFDVGQMAAEMYCLAAYRDRERGMALLDSFLLAYKERREGGIDAAKVAIRIAAHLIVMMPGAWSNEASEEQIKEQVAIGVDLLLRAESNTDAAALDGSLVQSLL